MHAFFLRVNSFSRHLQLCVFLELADSEKTASLFSDIS